jgi:eukaryotic-like serine/threonine-protein kinase
MGRVWRARDEQLDCDVAVKEVTLPPEMSEADRADRLARAVREARNAARMRNHPNIVSVHDMVTDQGLPWIVMDLIPARNLAQVVADVGPLTADQVVKVGQGVLEALAASHASGIMHRDVKPANVLLTNDGRVLLTDFGIAVQESDMTMTMAGTLVGSPEYVAPERARGEGARAASDLFSLGATLYFAAEGRSPFTRDSAVATLTAVLFENADHVRRLPQLDALIQGLLSKDPATRLDAAGARQELARLALETSGTAVGGWSGAGAGAVVGGGSAGNGGTGGTGHPIGGMNTPGGGIAQPHTTPMHPNYPYDPYGNSGSTQTVPQRGKTGRNVGIGIGAVAAAGAIVAAVVLGGHGGGSSGGASGGVGGLLDGKSSTSITSTPDDSPTTDPSSPDSSPSTTPDTSPSSSPFDVASLDSADTDDTPMETTALLPESFTDSKGVLYKATNTWTTDCAEEYESTKLKTILSKYNCTKQAVGTYTDSKGTILVNVAVMPLPDAESAKNAYADIKSVTAFTFADWGIWCPSKGAGSEICSDNEDWSKAQQYGYVLPYHRYILHATSIYVNLSEDSSAQDWLNPAATSGAKSAGPINYTGN